MRCPLTVTRPVSTPIDYTSLDRALIFHRELISDRHDAPAAITSVSRKFHNVKTGHQPEARIHFLEAYPVLWRVQGFAHC